MTLARSLDAARFDLRFACLRKWGPFVDELSERRIPLVEYPVSRASTVVQIAALTYSFPAAFIAVPADGRPIQLTLRRHGGLIRFAEGQRGWLSGNGVSAPSNVLFFPEPGGRFNGALFVEPGAYVVCRHRSLDDRCHRISILPGSEQTVDFSAHE